MQRVQSGNGVVVLETQSEPELMERLATLVRRRVGLRLRPEPRILQDLAARARHHRVALPTFLALLEWGGLGAEWDALVSRLTVGESYFFRDRGQMELLRRDILPEILRRTPAAAVQVWSAGCSTGEEAYSLAILLRLAAGGARLEHARPVLGSDVDPDALERARQGVYGSWSFRHVEPWVRERWFETRGPEEFHVLPEVRRLVRFERDNLLDPATVERVGRGRMDLILCRNVLLHFEPEAVPQALATLVACLRPGGFLLTGHGELQGRVPPELAAEARPESVIYRRGERRAADSPRPRPRPRPQPPVARPSPPSPPDLLGEARALGDAGDYERAREFCEKALEADPTRLEALFLAAQLAESRGDRAAAFAWLRRVLYLDPRSVGACLELASLHQAEGQPDRASRLRRTARDLLRALPKDDPVPPYGLPAGCILEELEG